MFPGFVSVIFPDSVSGIWFRDRMLPDEGIYPNERIHLQKNGGNETCMRKYLQILNL